MAPCVWYAYNYVIVASEYASSNPSVEIDHEGKVTTQMVKYQSTKRKILYPKLHQVCVEGIVGTGRIEFPKCVLREVCALYPLPNNVYIGFHPN